MDRTFTANKIATLMGKSTRHIELRAKKEAWTYIEENGNGRNGKTKKYALSVLPGDIQEAYIYKEGVKPEILPVLKPSAAAMMMEKHTGFDEVIKPLAQVAFASPQTKDKNGYDVETCISDQDLQNPRIKALLAILREAEAVPTDWAKGKRKWLELVAKKNNVRWQSIYRWIKKYEAKGIAGLRHTKSTNGQALAWTPEAVDFWVSLCGKREHRGANRRDLYEILAIEAQRRDWKIGGYESANWWFKKKWNPLLDAMQRGGMRALDNLLPPVLRDYSDLAPFQILVGDQHRFDRWVVDEETGEIFRPEGYLWQDLRTRVIYGAAVDKKYDAWLIGLALRIGVSCYGAFGSIYTDNGKPEISKFLTSVLANMHSLGMDWQKTEEIILDVLDVEAENITPCCVLPGTHRKAIVKNAKAKMIEGTFYRLEQIMGSVMMLPGQTKKLSDDIHWQDIDHEEAMSLVKKGKLLTSREFALAMYLACDHYNSKKTHRGVLAEWAWKPKPKEVTPWDCLKACYGAGWRPKMVSNNAADLIFLARASRMVNRGRISLENEQYESDALLELHGERVDIRYNPMTLAELHIFRGGKYLCTAAPVEYSSMIDADLASRKIAEKRERRLKFAAEFQKISAIAPDFRQYSKVPEAERVAALIGTDRKRRAIENKQFTKPVSQQEIEQHIEKMEAGIVLPKKAAKPLPERPQYFLDDLTRMEWIAKHLRAGGALNEDDEIFREQYLAAQSESQREFWQYQMGQS
ncbi:MAG: Mu transposase C-terminal domain-containing protein [Smithellaceae bacterium]|jgi:putative transposase